MNDWCYKVSIVAGSEQDENKSPHFNFDKSEREKMYDFIETCIGQEKKILITKESLLEKDMSANPFFISP
ncbi:hypothetical protein [Paenibacillus chitinolyticus]|uniref:hypothetical protein n=1 Tax=Paenibacillus chitinolyticus TaxID=79263 RepID=UPI001C44A280|nr:hypothetical protein [Paenibacillus chitinolyticus]MBV6717283.1 hypothetical protein [Paenibacillus chitinolyticus]